MQPLLCIPPDAIGFKDSGDISVAAVVIALYPVAGLFHLLALQSIYFLSAADIYLTAMEELLCAR